MRRSQGVTLLELLLVMVLISMIILVLVNFYQRRMLALQIEKTSAQMQVILNAGLAYYRVNEEWPADFATLQTKRFLPAGKMVSSWGEPFQVQGRNDIGIFTVTTIVPNPNAGVAIAGRIPMGTATATTVTGLVTIPAEEMNSARSTNFASVYHNGACVPAPNCPLNMEPKIYLLPVSAYGIESLATTRPICTTPNPTSFTDCSYPVTALYSVSVRAIGDVNGAPVDLAITPQMQSCYAITAGATDKCYEEMAIGSSGSPIHTKPITQGKYWRVCLDLITQYGEITFDWPGAGGTNIALFGLAKGSILAVTKCVPKNEPVGSSFKVWGK